MGSLLRHLAAISAGDRHRDRPVDKIIHFELNTFLVNCLLDRFGGRDWTSTCGSLRDFFYILPLVCTGGRGGWGPPTKIWVRYIGFPHNFLFEVSWTLKVHWTNLWDWFKKKIQNRFWVNGELNCFEVVGVSDPIETHWNTTTALSAVTIQLWPVTCHYRQQPQPRTLPLLTPPVCTLHSKMLLKIYNNLLLNQFYDKRLKL